MKIVGISDMAISTDASDTIITYSLGSCVGITFFDPEVGIGGMLHCLLPLSKKAKEKAKAKPCMFVDTGINLLLQEIFNLGAKRDNLITKVAGAGKLMDDKNMFNIGERNFAVTRKILWKNNILINGENIGGNNPKTMVLNMSTGQTFIKSRGEEIEI